jgi:translocation and assembly module TamA
MKALHYAAFTRNPMPIRHGVDVSLNLQKNHSRRYAVHLIKFHVHIIIFSPFYSRVRRTETLAIDGKNLSIARLTLMISRLTLCLLLAAAAHSFAAVPNSIAIDAPEPLRTLLRENLTLPEPGEMITDNVVNLPKAAVVQALELASTEGYFSATFKLVNDSERGGSSGLRLVVEAGKRSTVDTVEIIFAGDISSVADNKSGIGAAPKQMRMNQLRDGWLLLKGNPFRQADWTQAKRELLQNLFAEDYPTAVITNSLADVDAENATVSLRVELDSGPAYRLGALQIEGLKTYNQKLIDRYNDLYVGERYSQQRLREFQRALQNTPYFSSVLVDINLDSTFDPTAPAASSVEAPTPAPAPSAEPITVPVRVRVTEAQTKRLSLSAGFSSNNGGRGEVIYRDANILGRGWLLAVGLRADRIGQLGYADINLPITAKGYRDSFGVLAERSQNQGLTTTRQGVGVARVQNRGIIETRLSLAFQREQRDVDQTISADAAPVNNAPRDALALNYSWTWRNVDNVLDPRSGQVINAQIGGGAKALLSDQNFLRGIFKVQQYWTVFKHDLFTVRFEGGITTAESREGVPEEFLFRAGGAQSIRGYGYQSIGVSEGNATVGGRYLVAGTAEYVHWLGAPTTGPSNTQSLPKWGVAVFYDVGRANDSPKDLFPLLSGAGMGARWRSPAGPLALDLAYSVRDKKVRPVFSISIAF